MRFLRKDLCEKLAELGCVSQSGFFWRRCKPLQYNPNGAYDLELVFINLGASTPSDGYHTPAFDLSDFVENLPYAVENCKKLLVWRHRLLEDDWTQTIKRSYEFILAHNHLIQRHRLSEEKEKATMKA